MYIRITSSPVASHSIRDIHPRYLYLNGTNETTLQDKKCMHETKTISVSLETPINSIPFFLFRETKRGQDQQTDKPKKREITDTRVCIRLGK